jgi:hypothetical protein
MDIPERATLSGIPYRMIEIQKSLTIDRISRDRERLSTLFFCLFLSNRKSLFNKIKIMVDSFIDHVLNYNSSL